MLKCNIKKGRGSSFHINGTASDLANETCLVVNQVYTGIKKKDPEAAEIYKHKVMLCLLSPGSPVWTMDATDTNVGDKKEG